MYTLTDYQFNTIYNTVVRIQEESTDNLFIPQSVADQFDEISGFCDIILQQIDNIQETHTDYPHKYNVGNIIKLKDAVWHLGDYLIMGIDNKNNEIIYYTQSLTSPFGKPGDYICEKDAVFVRESL